MFSEFLSAEVLEKPGVLVFTHVHMNVRVVLSGLVEFDDVQMSSNGNVSRVSQVLEGCVELDLVPMRQLIELFLPLIGLETGNRQEQIRSLLEFHHGLRVIHFQIHTHSILEVPLDGVTIILDSHHIPFPIFYCESFVAIKTLFILRIVGTFV